MAIVGPGGELLPVVRCGPGRVYPWPFLVQGAFTIGQIWSRESQLVAIFVPGGDRLPLVRSDPGRVPVARFDPERAYPLLDFTRITADKRLTNVVNEPLSLMAVRASSESVAHTMNAHD